MRKRIPLIGSNMGRNVNPSSTKDQRFENCYPEVMKNSITGNAVAHICKRPGFSGTTSAASGYAALTGGIFSIATGAALFPYLNGTTLRIYDNNDAQIGGDITGVTGAVRISETQLSGTNYYVVVATKSADSLPHAWYMAAGAGAFTEITDGDYPANQGTPLTTRGSMVHMDGYAFIMDSTGKIWNSDINSLSAWTSTSFIDAQMYPDGGSGLARMKNLIVAFGPRSIEFFQNTGNATGSPLTRIPSLSRKVGAIPTCMNNSEPIWAIGDQIYFIGQNAETTARGVYRINGTAVEKVSTPLLDNELMSVSGGTPWGISGSFNFNGQNHLVIHQNSSAGTWCFAIDTNTWWYFTSPTITGSAVMMSAVPLGHRSQFTVATSRVRYLHDPSSPVYQDNGADYTLKIRTQLIDAGIDHKKEWREFALIADTQTTAGTISVQHSNDDFANFSTAKTIDMTKQQKALRGGLGWGRRRSWQITEAVARPFRSEAIELDFEVAEE